MTLLEAEQFLIRAQYAARCNFELVFTKKNKETITSLGYTKDDVREEILGLHSQDYVEGPITDKDGFANDLWIFGSVIQDQEIYIKLKINSFNNEGEKELTSLCVSFHFAEKKLCYPYKK